MTIWGVLAGGGFVLVGTGWGWLLAQQTAREERKWTEKQSVRQRLDEAAARLDEALVEMLDVLPRGLTQVPEARDRIREARVKYADARVRWAVLDDEGVERRVMALDMAVFIAQQDCILALAQGKPAEINFWPLSVGFTDLRKALTAYQRREDLPEAAMPTSKELIGLAPNRTSMDVIGRWLTDNGIYN